MQIQTITKKENPATYTSLGTVQIGSGLMVSEGGLLSLGWSITATAGTGGTISPAGTVHLEPGSSKTYTITADDTHIINDVLVDGISQGVISTYTFSDISANHTISVVFSDVYALFDKTLNLDVLTETVYGSGSYNVSNDLLNISSTHTGQADFLIYTKNAIDLTKFKKLTIVCDDISGPSGSCLKFIIKNSGGSVLAKYPTVSGTYEYDLSNYNDNYYLYIGVHTNNGTATAKYSKWELSI